MLKYKIVIFIYKLFWLQCFSFSLFNFNASLNAYILVEQFSALSSSNLVSIIVDKYAKKTEVSLTFRVIFAFLRST